MKIDTSLLVRLVAALGLSGIVCPLPAAGQCVDYGDYLNRVGGVDTPGLIHDVVVSGGFAYVAGDSGLLAVDLSDPVSPVIVGSVGAGAEARTQKVVRMK